MADIMSPAARSALMSRVRDRDTKPELSLRRALWRRGYRYRLRYPVPGKPDLVFPGPRVAVFVDGCFWHGCPVHGTTPASNTAFWNEKLSRNESRDREVTRELLETGWTVLRFWEHHVERDLSGVVTIVEQVVTHIRQSPDDPDSDGAVSPLVGTERTPQPRRG